MKGFIWTGLVISAVQAFSGVASAAVVEMPNKYFFFNAYSVEPDDVRLVEQNGIGFDIGFGRQLNSSLYAEIRGFRTAFEVDATTSRTYTDSGFGADLQLVLGRRGSFAAFALAGIGVAFNDVGNSALDKAAFQYNAGLGLLSRGLTGSDVRIRMEGRLIGEDYLDGLTDYRIGIGLEIPLDPVEIVVREVPVERVVERKGPDRTDAYPPRPVDKDRDGVLDNFDACTDTVPGARVDRSGCTQVHQTMILSDVQFEMDSSELGRSAMAALNPIAASLAGQPGVRVTISGHTDSLGSAYYNRQLSQRRADAVRDYLIARGISGDRVRAIGYGEDRPLVSNESEEGRMRNRRVEIEFAQ